MERHIFVKHKGKYVKISLKPHDFGINGWIDDVFEESFSFRTDQKTSYIEFTKVSSLIPVE